MYILDIGALCYALEYTITKVSYMYYDREPTCSDDVLFVWVSNMGLDRTLLFPKIQKHSPENPLDLWALVYVRSNRVLCT